MRITERKKKRTLRKKDSCSKRYTVPKKEGSGGWF
jgi:hypothetical protein